MTMPNFARLYGGLIAYVRDRGPQFIAILTAIFVLEIALLSKYAYINIDSGWLAEPANNFAKNGVIGSNSWSGLLGFDRHYYVWLPLFLVIEGFFIKAAGFGIAQVTLFNAVIAFLCFIATAVIARKLHGNLGAVIAVLILLGSFQFASNSIFHNRPETALAFFNLLAGYWLLKYSKKPRLRYSLIAAFFSAISTMLHPLGAIMFASVAFTLIAKNWAMPRRCVMHLVGIGCAFALLMLPWAFYVNEDIESFKAQWSWKTGEISPMGQSVMTEYVRYHWMLTTNQGAKAPFLLLLMLGIALYIWKREPLSLGTPVMIHLLGFFFLGSKATYYFDIITPLLAVYIAGIFINEQKRLAGGIILAASAGCALASMAALAAYVLFVSPNINAYATYAYLSEKQYDKVIAQSALYYAFEDSLYAGDAVFWRMRKGEGFEEIMQEVDADAFIYDPAVMGVTMPPEVREFLSQQGEPDEIVCSINHELAVGKQCAENPYRIEIYELKGNASG